MPTRAGRSDAARYFSERAIALLDWSLASDATITVAAAVTWYDIVTGQTFIPTKFRSLIAVNFMCGCGAIGSSGGELAVALNYGAFREPVGQHICTNVEYGNPASGNNLYIYPAGTFIQGNSYTITPQVQANVMTGTFYCLASSYPSQYSMRLQVWELPLPR